MPTPDWIAHAVPFAALVTKNPPSNRPLATRLGEQTIVGVIAALSVLQFQAGKQSEELRALRAEIADQRTDARSARAELETKIESLRAEMYKPILSSPIKRLSR